VSTIQPEPIRRIIELDGLRGWLALYVCIYHLTAFPALLEYIEEHAYFLRNGPFAVDVFFALSGFVLSYVYANEFASGVSHAAYWRFISVRVARLYPVHIFTFMMLALALLPSIMRTNAFLDHEGRYAWSAGLANVAMLHGPWIDHRSWNYPSWSISAEFHVYLIFPFIVRYLRHPLACALLFATAGLIPFVLSNLVGGTATNGVLVLVRAGALFVAGMAAFQLRNSTVLRSPVLAALSVACPALLVCSDKTASFAVLFAAPLLIGAMFSGPVARFLRLRISVVLGEISYSLYMVHAVVQILVLSKLRGVAGISVTQTATVAFCGVALSLLAACLVHELVEKPGRKLVLRALALRSVPAQYASSSSNN
jgi:peptidoglycan/LPS O-acetylase OafA/YrhL